MVTQSTLHAMGNGDIKAYQVVYDVFYYRVCRICRNIIRDDRQTQEWKDCAQEVFISLWENRQQFCKSDDFERYFIRTAVHKALRYARGGERRKRYESLAAEQSSFTVDGNKVIYEKELVTIASDVTLQVLSQSGKRQRQIYMCSRDTEMSCGEIAMQLNLSVTTVVNTITTVSKRIRNKLTPYL